MDMSQELISLFAILIVLIPLSRSDSFFTVTEDEAVQLEFPYPCDSNKVTIQSANRLPFYNSEEPASLILPFYQLHRFRVTDGNCSVQVEINPVNRNDEATYIRQAYKDGTTQSELTRIRLNVNYPPGDASCTFSIDDDADGSGLSLQCEVRVGSLAGEICCYQDSKRLPPRSNLAQVGETLKQTIWARKDYPIFCCSSSFDQPKDMCECKDFVWNPMENISHTKTIIDPCPTTTLGLVSTLSPYPEREFEDTPQLPQLIEPLNMTDTNKDKSIVISAPVLWGGVAAIVVIIMVIILISFYVVKKSTRRL